MKQANDEVMAAVASGVVSGEVATRAIEGRNKLRMLDDEEAQLLAGLKVMLGRPAPFQLSREEGELMRCVLLGLSRGYEARRELVRRRMENVDVTE